MRSSDERDSNEPSKRDERYITKRESDFVEHLGGSYRVAMTGTYAARKAMSICYLDGQTDLI